MLSLWKKTYIIRRWNSQITEVNGYFGNTYSDAKIVLDIQPNGNSAQPDESGKRLNSGIVSYGEQKINTVDKDGGKRGDWIWFNGAWYECVSSECYEHTIVHHWTSQFTRVSESIPPNERQAPVGG